MSQDQKPKGSIQPVEDVLSKGMELGVPKDSVAPDAKVDLSKQRALPADAGKKGMKEYDSKLNMHPEQDTVQYRRGPDDNMKFQGREDVFANQEQ